MEHQEYLCPFRLANDQVDFVDLTLGNGDVAHDWVADGLLHVVYLIRTGDDKLAVNQSRLEVEEPCHGLA